MAEEQGRVAYSKALGWHVDFGEIRWPGEQKTKRVRVLSAPGSGRIETEREAQKVLYQIWAQIADGKMLQQVLAWYVPSLGARKLVATRWEEFCDDKQEEVDAGVLRADRVKVLRAYIRRGYFDCWKTSTVAEIDRPALVSWIRWMRRQKRSRRGYAEPAPVGEKTIKNVLGDIAQFLRWLKDQGDILEVPTIPFDQLRQVEYMPEIPDAATVQRVLDAIPIEKRGIWVARSFMGFRPSEARRLNVADLRMGTLDDLTDAHIALPPRSSKKRRGRMLQLHPEVAAWLRDHGELDRWGSEPLFRNPLASNPQKRWTETSEKRTLSKALRHAGVSHIKPNEMGRHFFGTQAVSDEGADIYAVQEWLGHSDPKTTERYAKLRAVPIARVLRP
jgi:integrase